MTFPLIQLPSLPPNTIVPESEDLFIDYLNKLYEDISFTVNSKDAIFFPIQITDTPQNIPNMPNFGAFLVCVSGASSSLPTLTASLCKSDSGAAGSIAALGGQAGTVAPWLAATLAITSTATNFQIAHSATGISGNFNIRFLTTQ